MHLKWPLRIPGLNLKEERKGEWEGGRERKGEKEGRRGDGGEERKKRRDGRRHQLTKKKKILLFPMPPTHSYLPSYFTMQSH